MTRTGLDSSTDDYSAVGKVGITHELTSGSIVYAADVQAIYANGETVRKWFAGWNFMGTFARRYLVVEVNGSGSCHVEQDSDFSMDPFMPVLNRFVAGSQYVGENKGAERWAYDHDFSINCSHIANASTDEGGSPFLSSVIETFRNGQPVALISTQYSAIGKSPDEALFWPRSQYPDCDSNKVANFTTTGQSSICITDMLALEYGCM
jgi:hypothetical protein